MGSTGLTSAILQLFFTSVTSLEARSGNILSFLLPLFQEGQLSVTG